MNIPPWSYCLSRWNNSSQNLNFLNDNLCLHCLILYRFSLIEQLPSNSFLLLLVTTRLKKKCDECRDTLISLGYTQFTVEDFHEQVCVACVRFCESIRRGKGHHTRLLNHYHAIRACSPKTVFSEFFNSLACQNHNLVLLNIDINVMCVLWLAYCVERFLDGLLSVCFVRLLFNHNACLFRMHLIPSLSPSLEPLGVQLHLCVLR